MLHQPLTITKQQHSVEDLFLCLVPEADVFQNFMVSSLFHEDAINSFYVKLLVTDRQTNARLID